MGLINTLGGIVYENDEFEHHINDFYSSIDRMEDSKKKLIAAGVHLPTMEWGYYQPIIMALHQWPGDSGKRWMQEMGAARFSLSEQLNDSGQSIDGFTPKTKCGLLDAAVRKCFNSNPMIPMKIAVRHKVSGDVDRDLHGIRLEWVNDENGKPILYLTMVCPYKERSLRK